MIYANLVLQFYWVFPLSTFGKTLLLLSWIYPYCIVSFVLLFVFCLNIVIILFPTNWGRVTHICVSKLTGIGSDNGLSPGRRQAIIWTNAVILLIRTLGTNFSEILSEIHSFSFSKMHLKMLFATWRLFGLGLNELNELGSSFQVISHLTWRWRGNLLNFYDEIVLYAYWNVKTLPLISQWYNFFPDIVSSFFFIKKRGLTSLALYLYQVSWLNFLNEASNAKFIGSLNCLLRAYSTRPSTLNGPASN